MSQPVVSLPNVVTPPSPGRPEKLRLGNVLVQQRLISQEQLQQTLELQRQTGKKMGRLLIETGLITEELMASGLVRLSQVERSMVFGTPVAVQSVSAGLTRELARMQMADGQVGQTLTLLKRLEPELAQVTDVRVMRGNAARRFVRHADAAQSYQKALALRPRPGALDTGCWARPSRRPHRGKSLWLMNSVT